MVDSSEVILTKARDQNVLLAPGAAFAVAPGPSCFARASFSVLARTARRRLRVAENSLPAVSLSNHRQVATDETIDEAFSRFATVSPAAPTAAPQCYETVQDMFITPLYKQHASRTLASRVYRPQPHMRSSSATVPHIYTPRGVPVSNRIASPTQPILYAANADCPHA